MPLVPPSIMIGVLVRLSVAPLVAVAPPIMLFAVVVPFGGPIMINEPLAFMTPPAPVARKPTCPAELAVVVAVVWIVLPLTVTVLPDSATPPVEPAKARLTVLLPIVAVPPLGGANADGIAGNCAIGEGQCAVGDSLDTVAEGVDGHAGRGDVAAA